MSINAKEFGNKIINGARLPVNGKVLHASKFHLAAIFCLGFSSGLPFLLILSTLSIWLAESGVSKTQIGILAWVTIPYTLKFLWAPLIDKCGLPWLTKIFGQRRSWMLLAQVCLILSIVALGSSKPEAGILYTSICAFLVGLFSATQDIAVEAYRIEILSSKDCGLGASYSVLGYRFGMLCSGAGAIYLATYLGGWQQAYNAMALCMLVGVITTILIDSTSIDVESALNIDYSKRLVSKSGDWLQDIVLIPIKTFISQRDWWIIIPFILSYKIVDTVLNVMSMPFLLEIGFNKLEIAQVAKTFGILAMITGGMVGGALLCKYSLRRILFLSLVLQALASCLFVLQAVIGNNLNMLFLTMGVENFSCGLGQVALITYLSKLCSQPHTAMHYAILSSFASLIRVNFSMLSGWVADHLAWQYFYTLVGIGCIPGIIILFGNGRHFKRFGE